MSATYARLQAALRAIGGLTAAQVAAVVVVALGRGQAFATQLTRELGDGRGR
jgi:hypothetical protein